MKKVNLDEEYEKWKEENIEYLQDKFNDVHNFWGEDGFVQEAWEEYQEENGLIDKSNEVEE